MVAQLVEDLVHLERREHGLDQDRGLDGPARQVELVLGEVEDAVPEARFEVVLELGDVEVRAGSALEQPRAVVEDVEAEVEERAGDRLAVDEHVLLGQVPAARPHDEDCGVVGELVALAVRLELDRPLDRVDQVDLALDDVLPRGRVRVLEVGHEDARARVERVDHHLPIDGAGDLDATVLEIGGRGRHSPLAFAHLPSRGEEVRQHAGVELGLALRARVEQAPALGAELALERGDEGERFGGQDLGGPTLDGRANLDGAIRCRDRAHRAPGRCTVRAPSEGRARSPSPGSARGSACVAVVSAGSRWPPSGRRRHPTL